MQSFSTIDEAYKIVNSFFWLRDAIDATKARRSPGSNFILVKIRPELYHKTEEVKRLLEAVISEECGQNIKIMTYRVDGIIKATDYDLEIT